MSATSSYRPPIRDASSQISSTQISSFEAFSQAVTSKMISQNQGHTENSSAKKKVIVTRPSTKTESQDSLSKYYGYKDFITPDKLDGLKERLTVFIESSTVKNDHKRQVSFQLTEHRDSSGSTQTERNYLKPNFLITTEKKPAFTLDSSKICREKEKLLQATGCSSINEVTGGKAMAASHTKNHESENFEKPIAIVAKNANGNEKLPKEQPKNEKEKHQSHATDYVRRASADDQEYLVTKRNFGQLATIPQARQENDSPPPMTSTKAVKRARSDVLPRTIAFLDNKKNREMRFPMYAEKDLKFINPRIRNSLHETEVDDDVDTNDDQLELARAKVWEDLLEAMNEQERFKKIYRPRYLKDPRNPRRKVMTYFISHPDPHQKTPNISLGATQESYAKTLTSATTSDRSISSWQPQETEEKEQPMPKNAGATSNNNGRSLPSYTSFGK